MHTEDPGTLQENCLMGTLETWPLSELLLWLSKTGRNAMVRVGVGHEAGCLFLAQGFLYRAEWGGRMGTEALWELLSRQSGLFSVMFAGSRDLPRPVPNITLPTEQLLLQFAVSQDERRRGACA